MLHPGDNTKRRVGRPGWRAVLPNEKHEFSAGKRTAQKGWLAGSTTGRASGLHIKAGLVGCTVRWAAEKGGPKDCPFLQPAQLFSAARRTSFLCSPLASPSVFCAACRKFTFFIWKHGSPARPALQLVLSAPRDRCLPFPMANGVLRAFAADVVS